MTLAAALLLTVCAFAQDGKSIYTKYSDAENVSAVYISPAMFRMIGKLPDMDINGEDVDFSKLIQSLTGFFMLDSKNEVVNSKLKDDLTSLIKKGRYELLMEAKEDGETVRIYTAGDEKTINSFVLTAAEGPEFTFLCIDGRMLREDLEKIIVEVAE